MTATSRSKQKKDLPGPSLQFLELTNVGPMKHIRYEPAPRLNIITGDNSVGKTLLLDCLWYVLTNNWVGEPASPPPDAPSEFPTFRGSRRTESGHYEEYKSIYTWTDWLPFEPKEGSQHNFVVYARVNGSFSVADPAGYHLNRQNSKPIYHFNPYEIWNGVPFEPDNARTQWLSNGLIRDWVTWQISGRRYKDQFDFLKACLEALSPSKQDELLVPGEPVSLPFDSRDIPTLKLPYGDVPVIHTSSAIQRIISFAYIVVWAWTNYQRHRKLMPNLPAKNRMVFLMDEVESHLHPRWQRRIIPALIEATKTLSDEMDVEFHLTTHSPLVMASVEPVFDEEIDDLHHLKLEGKEILLEELPFVRRGPADMWLMSDVFGLQQARSLPAEEAIRDATSLQQEDSPAPEKVAEVHNLLVRLSAPDDEFWPLWTFFARQHGVKR